MVETSGEGWRPSEDDRNRKSGTRSGTYVCIVTGTNYRVPSCAKQNPSSVSVYSLTYLTLCRNLDLNLWLWFAMIFFSACEVHQQGLSKLLLCPNTVLLVVCLSIIKVPTSARMIIFLFSFLFFSFFFRISGQGSLNISEPVCFRLVATHVYI